VVFGGKEVKKSFANVGDIHEGRGHGNNFFVQGNNGVKTRQPQAAQAKLPIIAQPSKARSGLNGCS
jgi:hypothetical protein